MFAREERFRSASLDAGSFDAAAKLLTVTMSGSEQLLTALNWATFQYNATVKAGTDAAIGWEAVSLADKWDELQESFAAYFDGLYRPTTEDEKLANAGRVKIALSYYLAMTQGLVNMADPCPGLVCEVQPYANSSNDIAKGLAAAGKGVANVIRVCIEEMQAWIERGGKPIEQLSLLKDIAKGAGPLSVLGPGGHGKLVGTFAIATGLVVAGGIACLAIMMASAAKNGDTMKVIADVLQVTGIVLAGFGVIAAVGRLVRAAAKTGWAAVGKAALALGTNLKNSWELSKCLTTVVAIAMNFLVFMMQWGSGMAVGSLEWDNALAGAIAASLGAILMWAFFNAFGPIGTLVQACIALIDMLVGFICNLTGAYEKAPMAAKWFCGGITGFVNNFIKMWIYSGNVMVDMEAKNRMEFSGWKYELVHPEKGIVTGNSVNIKVDITNNIKRVPFPWDSLWADLWFKQWNDDNYKKSDFKYAWSTHDWSSVDAVYGSLSSLWQPASGSHAFTYGRPVNSTQSFSLGSPGIRQLKAYLIEGYAVPEQECWGRWPVGGCWVHANTGSNAYDIGSSISFAVLPETLDGFRSLAAKGAGYAQNWGSIRFPVLYDADNDGLPYTSDGDDHIADRDSDGMLDAYEVNIHSSASSADSDGDGLGDRQEVLAGTDPNLPDTDGDGLTDAQEVGHQDILDADHDGNTAEWLGGWQFVYELDKTTGAPSKSWVWSDPLSADGDGDTLSDAQERVYGYNPVVKSNVNILALESHLNELDSGRLIESDKMVAPGASLFYTATVTNQLLSREAEGLLFHRGNAGHQHGRRSAASVHSAATGKGGHLGRAERFRRRSRRAAYGDAGSRRDRQRLGKQHGWAILWMPFNNPLKPFGDGSGSLPPHDGTCLNGRSTAPSTGCTLDSGGRFGSALKLDGQSFIHSDAQLSASGGAISLWFKTSDTGVRDLFVTQASPGPEPVYVYLQSGIVYSKMGTSTYSPDTLSATGNAFPNYADGQWHHVVVTYGKATPTSAADVHKLYVDGALKGTGAMTEFYSPATPGFSLGGLASLGTHYSGWFPGMIDDLRIFDRNLSQAEVLSLYDSVAFSMNFNLANAWQDTSGYGTSVTCTAGYCPSVTSGSATFNGEQYLAAQGAGVNVGAGRLTLSAWIYPQDRGGGDARDTWYQGIVGYHSQLGEATAYPTLERYGLKLRFGFSTGTAWTGFTTGSNVLTLNTWNHVVATYSKDDGYARIYVNGVEKGDKNVGNFDSIASPTNFDIGRTTDQSVLKITHVDVYNSADDAGGGCPEYYPPTDNLCVALNDVEWFHEAVGCYSGDWDYNTAATINGTGSATLRMWENDGGDNCRSACDDDDDCGSMSPNYFSWTMAGTGAVNAPYSVDSGSGIFRMNFSNASVPFFGKMDDVQIYNRALSAMDVEELYEAPNLLLRLPFNEPPGAAMFSQSGGRYTQARCTHCPTAGVAGRIDQGVEFDGAGSYLTMPNSSVNQLSKEMTVAAWVKADTVTKYQQRIISSALTKTANGWGFGLFNSSLVFNSYGVAYYLQADSGVSLTLQPGRWYHLAAVFDSNFAVTFYVDGAYAGRVPQFGAGPADITPDTDDDLMIGGATNLGTPTDLFDGVIDDVQVHGKAMTADQVKALYDQAPVMHMRLDELQNQVTSYADSARYNVFAHCTAPGCPLTGEAVQGKVGLAADFDGADDVLSLADTASALYLPKFTIGGWVKPAGVIPTAQPLLAKQASNGEASYILQLQASTGLPELLRGCPPYTSAAGAVPLAPNQWSQVLATYDGATMRLYVNGVMVKEVAKAPATCSVSSNTQPLLIGGDQSSSADRLAGDLDELIIYNHALSAGDIAALYAYQLSWTEDREPTDITVDRDNPTAEVIVSGIPYYPNAPVVVPIGAHDDTSEVVSAQLCQGSSCGSPAPPCDDKASTTNWCPTFQPAGEGVYRLSAKVTDRVGHTATSDEREVRVDDTPPSVTIDGGEGQALNPVLDGNGNWTVHVTGTATDAGIGVPVDGVHVSLYQADGGLAGAPAQAATLSGNNWSVDYVLSESEASGCFTVLAEAVDGLVATYPGEAAHHTGSKRQTAGIGAAAPAVQIDRSFLTASQSLTGTLAGAVSANYVPVELSWTTGSGGADASITLVCQGPGSADTKYTAYQPGSPLGASQTYSWAGQVHRQATCTLTLSAAAGSPGVVSGSATVCGEEVASWADNQAASYQASFTASIEQVLS